MKKIPLLRPFMPNNLIGDLKKTLYSGWIGEGEIVKKLEKELAKYLGVKYVVCVNSGTSAIWIAARLAGLKKGDRVISTPMTCSATNIPFLHFECKIIWADINKNTGNISPKSIESKINKKTKLICIVDYGGNPCDMKEIRAISKKYQIPVIEDAAQAIGAEYNSKKVGSHNTFVCFSLQSVKTITSVDGGFLCLKNKRDYIRAKKLRWFGIDRDKKHKRKYDWVYDIDEVGYKMHMNDVLATIGLKQIKHLKKIVRIQRRNAQYYSKNLSGLRNIKILKENKNSRSSYWLYTLLVKNRKKFVDILRKYGVEASPIHQRNDKLSIFGGVDKSLKNVDYFDKHSICIPNGFWVDKKKRKYIVKIIKKHFT